MARRHFYAVFSVLLIAHVAALVLASNNFYWGASQTPGGDCYLFHRPLPHPLVPLLWACLKPLLIVTPLLAAWAIYACQRARAAVPRGPRAFSWRGKGESLV